MVPLPARPITFVRVVLQLLTHSMSRYAVLRRFESIIVSKAQWQAVYS